MLNDPEEETLSSMQDTCLHHWLISAEGMGKCLKCRLKKQFLTDFYEAMKDKRMKKRASLKEVRHGENAGV